MIQAQLELLAPQTRPEQHLRAQKELYRQPVDWLTLCGREAGIGLKRAARR